MDKVALAHLSSHSVIRQVVDEIVALLAPERVYLYSQKLNCQGEVTSFKLCVVGDFADKQKARQSVYWEVDSQLPFDVLLYTSQEWEELCEHPDMFARQIKNTGTIVYE